MLKLLDSTLREGEQTPGVYFDPHIKLAVAELLDEIGLDIIEAGHPRVSLEIRDVVEKLGHSGLKAKIAAHSRSLRADVDVALECGVSMLGIFYCVSESRLNGVFRKELHEAVDDIAATIAYAREQSPELLIRYTPEDTVRSELANVVAASAAAVRAGADIISVADTTGCLVPGTKNNMFDYVQRLRSELGKLGVEPMIAVHCHDDRGLALANALDGYRAGAEIIDVSVLGLGERAGIVDLATLMAVLATDFGIDRWDLLRLPELYRLVSDYAGVPIPVTHPVIGKNAFTHCAGVHTQAAMKDPLHYQSLDPAHYGRSSEISLDHMSGAASIDYALEQIGASDLDRQQRQRILAEVKAIGQKGRTVSVSELEHIVSFIAGRRATPADNRQVS